MSGSRVLSLVVSPAPSRSCETRAQVAAVNGVASAAQAAFPQARKQAVRVHPPFTPVTATFRELLSCISHIE